MKNEEARKITALGVVIFSFVSLICCLLIVLIVDLLTAFLVLKTALPEEALRIGSVIGNGIGVIASTAFLTAAGKMKGIVSAGVMSALVLTVKIVGNVWMKLGGYFTLIGFGGILILVVFSLIGGVLGAALKRG